MKWLNYCLLLVLFVCAFGCKTIDNTTYMHRIDTVYVAKIQKDSIWFKDSIYIKDKGDTIWMKEWHTKYVDRLHIDTVYKNAIDTCYQKQTITNTEKVYPKWLLILACIGGIFIIYYAVKLGIKLYTKIQSGGLF